MLAQTIHQNYIHNFNLTLCVLLLFTIGGTHAMVHMWSSEDNYVELVFSLHFYVGSRDPPQVIRIVWQSDFICWAITLALCCILIESLPQRREQRSTNIFWELRIDSALEFCSHFANTFFYNRNIFITREFHVCIQYILIIFIHYSYSWLLLAPPPTTPSPSHFHVLLL